MENLKGKLPAIRKDLDSLVTSLYESGIGYSANIENRPPRVEMRCFLYEPWTKSSKNEVLRELEETKFLNSEAVWNIENKHFRMFLHSVVGFRKLFKIKFVIKDSAQRHEFTQRKKKLRRGIVKIGETHDLRVFSGYYEPYGEEQVLKADDKSYTLKPHYEKYDQKENEVAATPSFLS